MSNASIGKIGEMYYDEPNDRFKWFMTMMFTVLGLSHLQQLMHAALTRMVDERVGRLAIIVIVCDISREQLEQIVLTYQSVELRLESYMPMGGGRAKVEFGAVSPTRHVNGAQKLEQEMLQRIVAKERTQRQVSEYYTFECHMPGYMGWTDEDVLSLVEIYEQAFTGYLVAFTTDNVREMLMSNVTAVARDRSGRIVSVAMAELAEILLNTGDVIYISEISEVATQADHHGKGLATALYAKLIEQLRCRDNMPVIFTEARANHGAIIAAAYKAGLTPCGTKRSHCVISSEFTDVDQVDAEGRETPYGNLVVMALLS